jgi:hypothetical protein
VVPVRGRFGLAPVPSILVLLPGLVVVVVVMMSFLLGSFVAVESFRYDQFGTVSVAFAVPVRFVEGFLALERRMVRAVRTFEAGLAACGFVEILPSLSIITIQSVPRF